MKIIDIIQRPDLTEDAGSTSSGGISTVIGGTPRKTKSEVGSLFGGTYTQQTTKKRKAK